MLGRALAVCLVAALPGICLTDSAAQTGGSGTFTMESEPGDYVGGGLTYSYDGPAVQLTTRYGTHVVVSVNGPERWSLAIAAPDGRRLEPRTYEDVSRVAGPGQATLDVGGEGRGCNVTHGFFTVHDVEYVSLGYVKSIHVSFEQRCEEPTAPALRGEAKVKAPPPPDPLEIELGFDAEGTVLDAATGAVVLRGSISCSQRIPTFVGAEVEEIGRAGATFGLGEVTIASCSKSLGWELSVHRSDGKAYSGADVAVRLRTEAVDQWWTAYNNGELVWARDEVETRAEVAKTPGVAPGESTPPTEEGSDGTTGIVARNPTASVIVGLGILLLAILATAALTLAISRRYPRRAGQQRDPEPPHRS